MCRRAFSSLNGTYERQPIKVTDEHGEVLAAIAYVIVLSQAAILGRPQEDYLARIITGARQHGLPEPYIGKILANAHDEILER